MGSRASRCRPSAELSDSASARRHTPSAGVRVTSSDQVRAAARPPWYSTKTSSSMRKPAPSSTSSSGARSRSRTTARVARSCACDSAKADSRSPLVAADGAARGEDERGVAGDERLLEPGVERSETGIGRRRSGLGCCRLCRQQRSAHDGQAEHDQRARPPGQQPQIEPLRHLHTAAAGRTGNLGQLGGREGRFVKCANPFPGRRRSLHSLSCVQMSRGARPCAGDVITPPSRGGFQARRSTSTVRSSPTLASPTWASTACWTACVISGAEAAAQAPMTASRPSSSKGTPAGFSASVMPSL